MKIQEKRITTYKEAVEKYGDNDAVEYIKGRVFQYKDDNDTLHLIKGGEEIATGKNVHWFGDDWYSFDTPDDVRHLMHKGKEVDSGWWLYAFAFKDGYYVKSSSPTDLEYLMKDGKVIDKGKEVYMFESGAYLVTDEDNIKHLKIDGEEIISGDFDYVMFYTNGYYEYTNKNNPDKIISGYYELNKADRELLKNVKCALSPNRETINLIKKEVSSRVSLEHIFEILQSDPLIEKLEEEYKRIHHYNEILLWTLYPVERELLRDLQDVERLYFHLLNILKRK